MELKRKIYNKLVNWKETSQGTSALLIEGARRIGKSHIATLFAKNEYKSYILIDFSKAPNIVKSWFDDYLEDIDTLLQNLQLHYKKQLTPRQSLIIFDEVQKCPRAREALKALVEDGRFDYLETGSLISIKHNVENILIPSEEDRLEMFPLDFEEFLWAMGNEMMWPAIEQHFSKGIPMGDFHREAMRYFREYMIVGGMPQAVLSYVESKDFQKVDVVKRRILKLYHDDIKKYALRLEMRVTAVYEEIPGQLQKHEKKFVLSSLKEGARMRTYADAFLWLDDAKIINVCYNTTAPNIGLRLNEDRSSVKCYMGDTGLLISHAFDARGIVSQELYQKLMFDKLEVNEGMLVENVVAQMLRAAGNKLFFFSSNNREDADERMEIDFLIQKGVITSRHNIIPIEVKSGRNYTLSSLNKCVKKYAEQITFPTVLHSGDLELKDGVRFLPLYMTGLL
ncbi:MAG: ATP-binding protein [Prevotellaceae bacterium]|nr:ATP-binding protein [Candidatus Faecinaster equi]